MKNEETPQLLKAALFDAPFKIAFKATLGFFVGQLVATLLGLLLLGLTGLILYGVYKIL